MEPNSNIMRDGEWTVHRDDIVTFVEEKLLYGGKFSVSDEASLRGEGILDSTAIMDLVLFIESKFQVSLADEDLVFTNFDSIKQICELVVRKTN